MKSAIFTAALLCLSGASLLHAQAQPPVINANTVMNAASLIPPGLPNNGIAPGSMFILTGQGLATATPFFTIADSPLPLTLAGASMQIAVAGTKVDVPMFFAVGGFQLAGIVPASTPTGQGTITVTFNGQTSAPAPIAIVPGAFGIFTFNQSGAGPGVFTGPEVAFRSMSDAASHIGIGPNFPDVPYPGNTLVAAAHPGDQLVIWGTGLGAPDTPVEVHVGNVTADVTSQGPASCCSGVDQIQFTVPDGVQGCYVPVAVRIGGIVSNFATVSISPDNNVCSDPAGWSVSDLQSSAGGPPRNVAGIGMERIIADLSVPGLGAAHGTLDFASGGFKAYAGPPPPYRPPLGVLASIAGLNGNLAIPSSGCVVLPIRSSGALFDNFFPGTDALPFGGDATYQFLDAGPALNIKGPAGARQLPKNPRPDQSEYKVEGSIVGGGVPPLVPLTPEFLVPGTFTVDNGSGGAVVKGFSATLTIPSDHASWTGQDAIGKIDRSQDLTITWSGSGLVAIFGNSSNTAARVGAQFICVAGDADNGSFTVPAWVMSALPASGLATDIPAPAAFLAVGTTLPSPTRFQAPGIDIGYFSWFAAQLKNVNFQ